VTAQYILIIRGYRVIANVGISVIAYDRMMDLQMLVIICVH